MQTNWNSHYWRAECDSAGSNCCSDSHCCRKGRTSRNFPWLCWSLNQNCSAKLLFCDTSCPHISSPDVKWISCYNPNTRILFTLWFKITFQYDIVVILQVLHFQVHVLNWTSCYHPNTRILFALQYDFVVILHVLPFQVQMSNESLVTIPTHKSCSLFDSKLLCSMTLWWYFKSLGL